MHIDGVKTVCILGAGGHAKVVLDALRASGWGGEVVLRDDAIHHRGQNLLGIAVTAPALMDECPPHTVFHVAVGDNRVRMQLREQVLDRGWSLISIIHPRATLSPCAEIGDGAFIAAGAIVGPSARVGSGAILNHNGVIDHDCVVGICAHIAPGAVLGGAAQVGEVALVGSAAVVLPSVKIGALATVGAGSVVLADVAPEAVVVGNPAKRIR